MWMLKIIDFILDCITLPIALIICIITKAKEVSRKIDIKLGNLKRGKK